MGVATTAVATLMTNGKSTPASTAAVMGLGTAASSFPSQPVAPRIADTTPQTM